MIHLLLTLAAVARAAVPSSADMFPPVERILSAVRPPAETHPRPPLEGLRDSLAPARDAVWLRAELRSADWGRRREAVNEVGRPGNLPAVPFLGAVVLRLNEDPRVRVAAAMSLGRIRDWAGARYLHEALRDPEVDVRFAAALALGENRAEGSATFLEKALRRDESWWVRYAAAVSLGKLGRAFSARALGEAAAEDPSWQVRLQAAKSLGEVKGSQASEALGKALEDRDPGVRAAAAMALGEVGDDAALDVLRAAMPAESDPFQRSLLTASLRKALR